MASSWGSSWGTSWASSWDAVAAVGPVVAVSGQGASYPSRKHLKKIWDEVVAEEAAEARRIAKPDQRAKRRTVRQSARIAKQVAQVAEDEDEIMMMLLAA